LTTPRRFSPGARHRNNQSHETNLNGFDKHRKNTREYGKKHKIQFAKFDKAGFAVYLAWFWSLVADRGSLLPPDVANKTTSTIATFLRPKPATLCAE
jgi:hypothetical protein